MGELEKTQGLALYWVATEHHNTDHPHVHVLLCGGAEDREGRTREVRLYREDHVRLREYGREYSRTEARERVGWEATLAQAAAADERERDELRGMRDDHDR